MYVEARKLNLIEKLLKVTDEDMLTELEAVLKKPGVTAAEKRYKPDIYDFVGIISTEEADEMRKAIEETCETIHPDDWK